MGTQTVLCACAISATTFVYRGDRSDDGGSQHGSCTPETELVCLMPQTAPFLTCCGVHSQVV